MSRSAKPERYCVVSLFDALNVGDRVDREEWPAHVTLVSNFVTVDAVDDVAVAVQGAAVVDQPLVFRFGKTALLGPRRDVLVRLADAPLASELHRTLAARLRGLDGFAPDEPTHWGAGYQAHLTLRPVIDAAEGEIRQASQIALARLSEDSAEIVAEWNLDKTQLPQTTRSVSPQGRGLPPALLLARHGQTEWNVVDRKQGQLDSPLTQAGVGQAHDQATLLIGTGVGVIFTSPLGRAHRTAMIMGDALGATVEVIEQLAEMHHGSYAGRTSQELAEEPHWRERRANLYDWRFPGGESYRDLDDRAGAALDRIRARGTDQALIVSHEMIGRMLVKHLCGLPAERALTRSHPHGVIYRWEPGATDLTTLAREASP